VEPLSYSYHQNENAELEMMKGISSTILHRNGCNRYCKWFVVAIFILKNRQPSSSANQ
jgi:hypothetical protein